MGEKKLKPESNLVSRTYLYFEEVESHMRDHTQLEDQFRLFNNTCPCALHTSARSGAESHRSKNRGTGRVQEAINSLSLPMQVCQHMCCTAPSIRVFFTAPTPRPCQDQSYSKGLVRKDKS